MPWPPRATRSTIRWSRSRNWSPGAGRRIYAAWRHHVRAVGVVLLPARRCRQAVARHGASFFLREDVVDRAKIKAHALQSLLKKGLENKSFPPTPQQVDAWKARLELPEMTRQDFDLVLVTSAQNVEIVFRYLTFYLRNICPRRIVLVTRMTEEVRELFQPVAKDVLLMNEDEVMEGLTFGTVKALCPEQTGWYFQQFLKMAYALRCSDPQYLIMDGDTIPLRPLHFFEGGKTVLLYKGEYYPPYFIMIKKLFGGEIEKSVEVSFIAECMLINTSIMREMIDAIAHNDLLAGENFYEKILHSVQKNGLKGCDFSEFETYGNYVYTKYKDSVVLKKIASLRDAQKFFEGLPPLYALEFLSRDFTTISLESKHQEYKDWRLIDYINKCMTATLQG